MRAYKKISKTLPVFLLILVLSFSFVADTSIATAQTACTALPTDKGQANSDITATSAGTYYVWVRMMAPDTVNNSVYVQVNNSLCNVNFGDSSIPANTWTWVNYRDGNSASKVSASLTTGTNKLYVAGRENGVKVDKVIFTANSTCIPSGFGENCTTNQPDTTPPSAPSSLTSSGVSQTGLKLSWNPSTDDKAVTGYEIYRNGSKIATSTTNSYTVSGLVASTTYSFYVKAYDAVPNVSASSNTIQVTTLATTPVTKQGDINGDSKVDIVDLNYLISNWDPSGAKPGSLADFNKDNKVDLVDLNYLISGWTG
jgi:hypothetical protein